VDNQVYQQKNPTHIVPALASTSASSSQSTPKMSDEATAAEQIHKPVAPFPNWLRNNNKNMHMEKILEMLNQVKLNVPLLNAIQQVPAYAKFLKNMCTKKRKTNVPKKAFLATNISEILPGPIPVKYKDPGCPTISCTIGQTEISRVLLDLGAKYQLATSLSIPATQVGRDESNSSHHSVSRSIYENPQGENHKCPYPGREFHLPR